MDQSQRGLGGRGHMRLRQSDAGRCHRPSRCPRQGGPHSRSDIGARRPVPAGLSVCAHRRHR